MIGNRNRAGYRRPKVMIERSGGDTVRIILIIYTIFFWASGIALIFIGLWMPLDPKRNYILELVHFSEDDPLLWFTSMIALVTGIATLAVGFLGCCGALRRMRCLLVGFMIALIAIFLADVAIGTLALVYRNKFTDDRMQVYMTNLTQNRYNRDYWVKPLVDTIQFYQSCCGGTGPRDYENSFWYITNTLRGTRSFVPPSCCKQTQQARAWSIVPVDPMCITYFYDTQVFNDAVYNVGCYEKLQKWFNEQAYIFTGIGFGFALFIMLGLVISLCLCSRIHYYTYLDNDHF